MERNERDNLGECVSHLKPYVSQVVICDQDSTDGSFEIAKSVADIVVKRKAKGYADPDRQFAYNLADQEWILALDPDERVSADLINALPHLINDVGKDIDIFWIPFTNLVDGINIQSILGEDPHPRLWRAGVLQWPAVAHTFPKWLSCRHLWLKRELNIIHSRTWEGIRKSHAIRGPEVSPQAREQERNFLQAVERLVGTK